MVPNTVRYQSHDLDYVLNDPHVTWMAVHASCRETVRGMAHRPAALPDARMLVVGSDGPEHPHHADRIDAGAPIRRP